MLAGQKAVVVTFFAAGSFITSQTASAKFVFDKEDFYLDTTMDDGNARRENPVVGGENRWAYSSFKNWRFFPGHDHGRRERSQGEPRGWRGEPLGLQLLQELALLPRARRADAHRDAPRRRQALP